MSYLPWVIGFEESSGEYENCGDGSWFCTLVQNSFGSHFTLVIWSLVSLAGYCVGQLTPKCCSDPYTSCHVPPGEMWWSNFENCTDTQSFIACQDREWMSYHRDSTGFYSWVPSKGLGLHFCTTTACPMPEEYYCGAPWSSDGSSAFQSKLQSLKTPSGLGRRPTVAFVSKMPPLSQD
ncbi:uncharacterized protein MELLADRAFT_113059 [Melampsora larici-populina 98AG31]|uniref:Uncharacterized protein n=1 Tax=Melampsora larici-populina (strain 98AG31 / pathotype 3-4-7) TaxID=747676 RepID=F4S8M8_MELLP|nr:uncharacterized protein MELLADRAFT_113059 [Melampsora larici-populina 98AG31]EGF99017.1 hypothetical protein MELLADRAFT_113059 [Melampsora larici-populina 98AG31]